MPPLPVLIDCDPGADDAVALLLACASPALDVRAVTVCGGNAGVARTAANAAAVLALAGHPAPLYAGAAGALLAPLDAPPAAAAADSDGGLGLPPGPPPTPGVASDAIRALLRDSAAPLTIVGIAPATNLALALMAEPALAAKVARFVLMAGASGGGNATRSAEFNARSDPEALACVLAAGRPVTLAPLDLTAQARVTPARLVALRAQGGGRCLAAASDILAAAMPPGAPTDAPTGEPTGSPPRPRPDDEWPALHDPCAVAWLLRPELFSGRDCHVGVDLRHGAGRGRTVIDRAGRSGRPANATVLESLDADAFFRLLGERLAALP